MPNQPLPARPDSTTTLAVPLTRFGKWRRDKGWSLTQCADLAGWGPSLIKQVELGRRKLSPAGRVKLASALGVRVRELFEPTRLPRAPKGRRVP
jgi:transcriptional regulator with XRE-family HTH domain